VKKVYYKILLLVHLNISVFEGLDDWDFVALNDFSTNIRWFNVDNRSIIATVNQSTVKQTSTLNKAISMCEVLLFETICLII
jgi:archaellum biogenesis ATPase FlaH